ncbi:uncharacterized protein LOC121411387 [Lytechinus variegatus]|uniref:uncharacterized protein LOC121411387 n=1 Tax=Lytechinus variegatus TaxID=7654 RepID=UPI001BB12BC9|nr:uncharacterized protein LOC121411387 [Lytechinus variegatus]XP_041460017.1 uncharacterized protein LOC121411387 [Lytechinus variegatus]
MDGYQNTQDNLPNHIHFIISGLDIIIKDLKKTPEERKALSKLVEVIENTCCQGTNIVCLGPNDAKPLEKHANLKRFLHKFESLFTVTFTKTELKSDRTRTAKEVVDDFFYSAIVDVALLVCGGINDGRELHSKINTLDNPVFVTLGHNFEEFMASLRSQKDVFNITGNCVSLKEDDALHSDVEHSSMEPASECIHSETEKHDIGLSKTAPTTSVNPSSGYEDQLSAENLVDSEVLGATASPLDITENVSSPPAGCNSPAINDRHSSTQEQASYTQSSVDKEVGGSWTWETRLANRVYEHQLPRVSALEGVTSQRIEPTHCLVTIVKECGFFDKLLMRKLSAYMEPIIGISSSNGWLLVHFWEGETYAIDVGALSNRSDRVIPSETKIAGGTPDNIHKWAIINSVGQFLNDDSILKVVYDAELLSHELGKNAGLKIVRVFDVLKADRIIRRHRHLVPLVELLHIYGVAPASSVEIAVGSEEAPLPKDPLDYCGKSQRLAITDLRETARVSSKIIPFLYQTMLSIMSAPMLETLNNCSNASEQSLQQSDWWYDLGREDMVTGPDKEPTHVSSYATGLEGLVQTGSESMRPAPHLGNGKKQHEELGECKEILSKNGKRRKRKKERKKERESLAQLQSNTISASVKLQSYKISDAVTQGGTSKEKQNKMQSDLKSKKKDKLGEKVKNVVNAKEKPQAKGDIGASCLTYTKGQLKQTHSKEKEKDHVAQPDVSKNIKRKSNSAPKAMDEAISTKHLVTAKSSTKDKQKKMHEPKKENGMIAKKSRVTSEKNSVQSPKQNISSNSHHSPGASIKTGQKQMPPSKGHGEIKAGKANEKGKSDLTNMRDQGSSSKHSHSPNENVNKETRQSSSKNDVKKNLIVKDDVETKSKKKKNTSKKLSNKPATEIVKVHMISDITQQQPVLPTDCHAVKEDSGVSSALSFTELDLMYFKEDDHSLRNPTTESQDYLNHIQDPPQGHKMQQICQDMVDADADFITISYPSHTFQQSSQQKKNMPRGDFEESLQSEQYWKSDVKTDRNDENVNQEIANHSGDKQSHKLSPMQKLMLHQHALPDQQQQDEPIGDQLIYCDAPNIGVPNENQNADTSNEADEATQMQQHYNQVQPQEQPQNTLLEHQQISNLQLHVNYPQHLQTSHVQHQPLHVHQQPQLPSERTLVRNIHPCVNVAGSHYNPVKAVGLSWCNPSNPMNTGMMANTTLQTSSQMPLGVLLQGPALPLQQGFPLMQWEQHGKRKVKASPETKLSTTPQWMKPMVLQFEEGNNPFFVHPLSEQAAIPINPCHLTDDQDEEFDELFGSDVMKFVEAFPENIRLALHQLQENPNYSFIQLAEVILDVGRKPKARYLKSGFGSKMIEKVLDHDELTKQELKTILEGESFVKISKTQVTIRDTLHRLGLLANRQGEVIGITAKVEHPLPGCLSPLYDVFNKGKSILVLGPTGVGKTTLLREAARVLSDVEKENVMIIDTLSEIAGEGDIPHQSVGTARRLQVIERNLQHTVMREAYQNHRPKVVIIDEISSLEDAKTCLTMRLHGIQLIAGVHGQTIADVLLNPALAPITGATMESSTVDNPGGKKVRLRTGPAVFNVVVEMLEKERWVIHWDFSWAIDALLPGGSRTLEVEERKVVKLEGDADYGLVGQQVLAMQMPANYKIYSG